MNTRNLGFVYGMHVFWTWAPFFGPVHVLVDLAGFFWTWVFSGPGGDFFLDLHVCVLEPGKFF